MYPSGLLIAKSGYVAAHVTVAPLIPQGVLLSDRDLAMLRLLDLTPATAMQIRKASVTFGDDPFRDERRVRERLQTLAEVGLVRAFPAGMPGGGVMHYYRLTQEWSWGNLVDRHRTRAGAVPDSAACSVRGLAQPQLRRPGERVTEGDPSRRGD